MKNYIWLNPVVEKAYGLERLTNCLKLIDYIVVLPQKNHPQIILKQYQYLLSKIKHFPVLDQRCPLIYNYFKKRNYPFTYHYIDPILIHTAKELANREDLKDGYKWIITPCTSLKDMGNNLSLDNTIFMTWDSFKAYHHLNIWGHDLQNSPIPFGFFNSIEKNIVHVSDENIDQVDLKNVRLIEGLYCHGGCHNGDGVKCLKVKK